MLKNTFFKNNRDELVEKLEDNSLALLFSGREIRQGFDEYYPFIYDTNYFYLTGLTEPEGILALKKNSEFETILFIPEPDLEKEKWVGKKYSINQANRISGITDIRFLKEFDSFLKENENLNLYLDKGQMRHQLPSFDINLKGARDLSSYLNEMRLIKKPEEIEEIKTAIDITNFGLNEILSNLHPGEKEKLYEAIFEYAIKKKGADSLSFSTIAASGPNGPILHYVKNDRKVRPNDLILFDLGARVNGYCADISRTYPVSGSFTDQNEKFYKALLNSQKEIIKLYIAGSTLKDIQEKTKEILTQNLKKEGIKIPKEGIDKWYYHNIGHSLGINTHDASSRDFILEDNMVITCEPGIYASEYNIGLRIEDDILINQDQPIVLSSNIPKEIDQIERLIR